MLIDHGQTYYMNHWAHKQLPFSWQPKDITLQWSGSDHADSLYNNSQKDAWNNIDISYQYNAQGYRTKDLISMYDKKVDIALGCSLTEGIGLPIGGTWPSLVEESRDYPQCLFQRGFAKIRSSSQRVSHVNRQRRMAQ